MAKVSAAARAEPWRLIYLALGPERSLARVSEAAALAGLTSPPSIKTLKRWSADFGWVDAAKEYDRARAAQNTEVILQDAYEIDRRHGSVGRALQQIAMLGIGKLAPEQGGVRVLSAEVRPGDVARLAEAGVRIERLSAGLATERTEVLTQVWNTLTVQIVELFLEVNEIGDANARALRFAQGVDAIVEGQLAPVARRRIDPAEG